MRKCDGCGLTYAALRTGYTFAAVVREMYVADPDPTSWRNKRRHGVLGYWHELKQRLWKYHLSECRGE